MGNSEYFFSYMFSLKMFFYEELIAIQYWNLSHKTHETT